MSRRTTRTRIRGGKATTRTTRDAQGRYSGSRGGLFGRADKRRRSLNGRGIIVTGLLVAYLGAPAIGVYLIVGGLGLTLAGDAARTVRRWYR